MDTERIPPDDGEEAYDLSTGNSPLDLRPCYPHSVDPDFADPVYWCFSVSTVTVTRREGTLAASVEPSLRP